MFTAAGSNTVLFLETLLRLAPCSCRGLVSMLQGWMYSVNQPGQLVQSELGLDHHTVIRARDEATFASVRWPALAALP